MEIKVQFVDEFSQGVRALKASDYSKGVLYFRVALNKHKQSDTAQAKCMAYRQKNVIAPLNRTSKLNEFLGHLFRKSKKSMNVYNVLPAAA